MSIKFEEFATSLTSRKNDTKIYAFINYDALINFLGQGSEDEQSDRLIFVHRSDVSINYTLRDEWLDAEVVCWAAFDEDTIAVLLKTED